MLTKGLETFHVEVLQSTADKIFASFFNEEVEGWEKLLALFICHQFVIIILLYILILRLQLNLTI